MIPESLHSNLMEACNHSSVEDVKHWLAQGADPNFNLKSSINALDTAIQIGNHEIIDILVAHGAVVQGVVLQKSIEKDKSYLARLLPDFGECKDQELLMAVLHAAINSDDLDLAKQAVEQGAKPASIFLYAIKDFGGTEILRLLLENGFDIHVNNNMLMTEWMGSCLVNEWGRKRRDRKDFLVFISDYYLDKPESIEKFHSWRATDKLRLFRLGLSTDNLTMMKFACLIGVELNQALNAVFYTYYARNHGHKDEPQDPKSKEVQKEIILYILSSDITFTNLMISNAICFKYMELLFALSRMEDLEYAYEMAYSYRNDELCDFFIERGVSQEAQRLAKMRVSAIRGDIKVLRKAVNEGGSVEMLTREDIVKVINANQVESLKYLNASGVVFDSSFNSHLDNAMFHHKAYDTISYLVEQGLDITFIEKLPLDYKIEYPVFTEMWEKRFHNVFDYTLYLAGEVHPKVEGREKARVLKKIAELSTLPYVIKKSEEKAREQ